MTFEPQPEYNPDPNKNCCLNFARPTNVGLHRDVCEKLNSMYARKNAGYKDSFGQTMDKYGLLSVNLRLTDKLNRLDALWEAINNVDNLTDQLDNYKSMEDTLLDLANYAIMGYMWLSQTPPQDIF